MNKRFYKPKEVADRIGITVRTLQYYDKVDVLKPSYKNENGYRFYTEKDLKELQKIISLKFLGFSIEDIKRVMDATTDEKLELIKEKKRILEHQIKKLTLIDKSLEAVHKISDENEIDWCEISNNVKAMRIQRHKEECMEVVKDKKEHNLLHGALIGVLIDILKSKEGSELDKNVAILKEYTDKMVKGNRGIEIILEHLEDISDMPGQINGISGKEASLIKEKIKSALK